MLYPKNAQKQLDISLFENPTAEYRCTPFWAWNCELKKDELFREIDAMKQMGMGGFHMHTRTGMATKYLSDDFMQLIKGCTEKAKQENMLAWLYDEDKWPSGFGGGYVTKKKENRQKFLLLTATPYADERTTEEQNDASGLAKRSNNGYLLATYDVCLDADGYLDSYCRVQNVKDAKGDVWYAYVETPGEGPWFNFQTYVDTLSKPAIDDFIAITHERYKQVVGDDFGKTVPAIFTDEPQTTTKTVLDFSREKKDIILPFTTDLPDTYQAAYHEDLLDKLPEIIWEKRGTAAVTRYRYTDHVTERFVSSFCDNIGTWCRNNNILMTGHVMNEGSLPGQTRSVGEAMRAYRRFGLPGVDMLCDDHEYVTVKQAASAAHQYGRPGVMSELYGVTNWDFDFRGHKLQGDWQAALGVSVRVPHLYWVSMKGEAKRDYPASIGHQSAWYTEYPFIEDHFARVNTLMTRGTPDIKVGVIHPIESYWLCSGPNDLTSAECRKRDAQFHQLAEWFLFGTLDFDYICESLLPEQHRPSDGGFAVGEMRYDVVVVPDCATLRATTVQALSAFAAKGGKVIFMGGVPTLMDAVPSNEPAELAKRCVQIGWDDGSLFKALEAYRDVTICDLNGRRAQNLFCSTRNDGNGKNMFICHVRATDRTRVDRAESYRITLRGSYIPTVMDTKTGKVYAIPATYENGNTVLLWDCYPQSSLLLRLDPGKTEFTAEAAPATASYHYLSGKMQLKLEEPNVCVLDMAEWKIDDGEWQEKEEMLRIAVAAKQKLNISAGSINGAQPWVAKPEPPTHTVSLKMTFNTEIDLPHAELALEELETTEIWLDGKTLMKNSTGYYVDYSIKCVPLGQVSAGVHEIEIRKPFGVISNTENLFILGDFGVTVCGTDVRITAPVRELAFGDWTRQGLPFYGGAASYSTTISGGQHTAVELGLFAASCVTVWLDGKKVDNVSLAPYRAELGDLMPGEHTLELRVYASRINTFGQLHLCDGAERWFGPPSWRTTGADWSYEYQLKAVGLLTAPRLLCE